MKEIFLLLMFLVPWLSLLFIGQSNLRRFLPVALVVTVINTLIYQAAYHYNWWREMGLFDWDKFANVPWVYGSYLVATIWIFRFTYGRFTIYLITNVVLDGAYIYLWYPIQENMDMASGELSPHTTYLMMLGIALLIYLFQIWYEQGLIYTPSKKTTVRSTEVNTNTKNPLIKIEANGKWDNNVKSHHNIRGFDTIIMDEPVEFGGTDIGPSPMEFVAAALNGCKGIMIPLIAKEQDFTFSNIEFNTTGILDINGFMGESDVTPHFQKVRFTVNIETDETDEALEKLKLAVEKRSPVFNLLLDAGIQVTTNWKKLQ